MSPGVPGGPSVITGIFTSREPPPAQTWSERRGEEMRLQGKPELHCVRRIRPMLAGCENAGRICKPRNAGSLRRLRRTRQPRPHDAHRRLLPTSCLSLGVDFFPWKLPKNPTALQTSLFQPCDPLCKVSSQLCWTSDPQTGKIVRGLLF